jgi:hypothetical protein
MRRKKKCEKSKLTIRIEAKHNKLEQQRVQHKDIKKLKKLKNKGAKSN